MMWMLILSIMTFDGVTSQKIEMTEVNCKHYEAQYNSGLHDDRGRTDGTKDHVVYKAQCLRTS